MFLPNLATALTRLRELLVPGGSFATAVWGTAEQVPFNILNRVIRQVLQLPPPPPGTPSALGLSNEDRLRQHFQEAGFTEIHTERATVTLEHTSPDHYIEERLATSANTRVLLDDATEDDRTRVCDAVAEAVQPHTDADGMIRLRNETILLSARNKHG